MLAVRYRRMDWEDIDSEEELSFDLNTNFFDALHQQCPKDFAEAITHQDVAQFRTLKSMEPVDVIYKDISSQWNDQCRAVTEAILVDSQVAKLAVEVALVSHAWLKEILQLTFHAQNLRVLRNYHSLHAFLQGFQAAGCVWMIPKHLRDYISDDSNYLVYRNALKHGPCLPFLFPHCREYQLHGLSAVEGVYGAISSYELKPGTQLCTGR